MARMLIIQDMALEYFGVEMISAVAKEAGHEIELRIMNIDGKKKVWDKIRSWKPDIIGFPIMSVGYMWSIELAKEIKEDFGIINIFGGPHPTFWPQMIDEFPSVDMICCGEGEGAVVDLLDALDKDEDYSTIKNLNVRVGSEIVCNDLRDFVSDLDALPFFDREIYFERYPHLRNFPAKRFITDRGCPHNCFYCFNFKYREMYKGKGKYMRLQSPERAVAEIEDTVKRYGARMVTFTNDSFTWNRKWMREFLAIYKERIGKPFAIQCRIKEFNSEDVKLLADAGCYSAMFGIESGSPRVRELILNRKMTNDEIIEGCKFMKDAGIKVITANMFGIPTETMEEAWQTLDLNIAIGTDVPSSTIFQAMPGTESFELLKKQNLLVKGHDVTNVQTQFGGSNIDQADIEKMVNLQRLFYFVVRYPILRGITTWLVNYNLTFIYKPIWALGFMMKYVNSRQLSIFETIKTGWYMRQIFLKVKR